MESMWKEDMQSRLRTEEATMWRYSASSGIETDTLAARVNQLNRATFGGIKRGSYREE